MYFIIPLPFLLAFSNLIRKVNVGCIQVLALELSKGFIGTYVKGFNSIWRFFNLKQMSWYHGGLDINLYLITFKCPTYIKVVMLIGFWQFTGFKDIGLINGLKQDRFVKKCMKNVASWNNLDLLMFYKQRSYWNTGEHFFNFWWSLLLVAYFWQNIAIKRVFTVICTDNLWL